MSLAKRNSEAAKAWAAKRRESKERALLQERTPSSSSSSASTTTLSARSRRPVCREATKPPRNAASTSHEANTAYMDEFRENMANMYSALEAPSSHGGDGLVPRAQGGANRAPPPCAGRGAASLDGRHEGEVVSDRIRRRDPGGRGGCFENRPGGGLLGDELKKDTAGGVASGWRRGPVDPAGHLVDLSDRHILCSSVSGDEAVFGSADHALYCVDLSRGVKTRQLYGSRSRPDAGHKEWVSAVAHTAHGDIVSAGMDGKLCLWPRAGGSGGGSPGEVQAHAGSISALKADSEGRVATSGYGGALRVWDCRSGGRGASAPRLCTELSDRALPSPCMDFAWSGCRLMTGHRDGRVGVYDLGTGALVCGGGGGAGRGGPAHRGHVTTVNALAGDGSGGWSGCFVTGGQDGFVRIWDHRVGESGGGARRGGAGGGSRSAAVMESPAHRGTSGIGAVGGVISAGRGGNRLASFGADRRVCILEVRGGSGGSSSGGGGGGHRSRSSWEKGVSLRPSSSLAIGHVFEEHRDFIYCADFIPAATGWDGAAGGGGEGEGVLVTGGGDGMLLVHDLGSMRLLYGLGCCSAGAVRCVVAGGGRLTVGGDDGNAMLYNFDDERSGK